MVGTRKPNSAARSMASRATHAGMGMWALPDGRGGPASGSEVSGSMSCAVAGTAEGQGCRPIDASEVSGCVSLAVGGTVGRQGAGESAAGWRNALL